MSAANASAIVESLENRLVLDALPAGPEFRVNTYTTGFQNGAQTAMDADGDFVVVWTSYGDGSGEGIYAQRYNAVGVAQGVEFRVNTHTLRSQGSPAVAMDADGDFVVTWSSLLQDGSDHGIYAQRYNASGVAQGAEFRVNTTTIHGQDYSSVAMDADGDFVVAWQGYRQDGFGSSVHAQRFNAAGAKLGGEFRVNTSTSANESSADVAMSADGTFAIAWRGTVPGGAYVQRYSAAGVPQGGEVRVNTYTGPSTFASPSIAMDADGNFVVVWSSSIQNGGTFGVYGQRFDAAGVAQGEEFHVSSMAVGEIYPTVDMNADGAFVVTWSSFGDVHAREFNSAGVAQGPDFRVNTYTTNTQWFSDVAMDDDGNFVIAWTSEEQDSEDDGVFAQRYEALRAPSVTASAFQFETAPQRLRFTFDQDVSASLTLDDIVVRALPGGPTVTPGGLSYDTTTNTATVTFSGILADAHYRATLIAAGISGPGGTLPTDYVLPFFFLSGDANRDARVNLDDFNVLAANFGQSPRTFSQGDFTYDGLVNLNDFNVLAARFGATLGPSTSSRPTFFDSPPKDDADALIETQLLA